MRAVVQRALRATVEVDGRLVGALNEPGLCVFLGVTHTDDSATAARMADKLLDLRILRDDRSAAQVGAPLLVVSQFTVYGDTRKGRRPTWTAAAPGHVAEPLVDHVVSTLRDRGATVATGRFGATMQVDVVNDGPVTVIVDVDAARPPSR